VLDHELGVVEVENLLVDMNIVVVVVVVEQVEVVELVGVH
jgi:hypothetical protein